MMDALLLRLGFIDITTYGDHRRRFRHKVLPLTLPGGKLA